MCNIPGRNLPSPANNAFCINNLGLNPVCVISQKETWLSPTNNSTCINNLGLNPVCVIPQGENTIIQHYHIYDNITTTRNRISEMQGNVSGR